MSHRPNIRAVPTSDDTGPPSRIPSAISIVDYVPISQVRPSPLNPRKQFRDLDELAANIRAHRRAGVGGQPETGIVQPLLTRPHLDGGYEIVEGERRYRAAQIAGETHLPIIARTLTDDEVLELQLLTNGQRMDLTPLEEARGYRALIDANRSKYSTAYIADRISRSEKYVADRMRLLDLIEPLQRLLDEERILVGHAELLAKLKPEDQERAAGLDAVNDRECGGLWTDAGRTLAFEDEADLDDKFHGFKPVSVKELEAWIARHVRFDVAHAAATAPLDFGATAIAVETAQQQPGRGRKVVSITEDHRVEDDARTDERVYGANSWKAADARDGTTGETCAHTVLGVYVVGPGYGTTRQVCIAKDRCEVHWGREIKARAKARTATTAKGAKGKAPAATEDDWKARQAREEAERQRQFAAYKAVYRDLEAAIAKATPAQLTRPVFDLLWPRVAGYGAKRPADLKPSKLTVGLVLALFGQLKPQEWRAEERFKEAQALARAVGVDVKPFAKAYADHVAAAVAADKVAADKAKAKAAAPAPATGKATPARKAAKRR